ncbi:CBS and Zinc Finger C2H2 domain-containing membrane protein [Candidatus Nitrososphaera gargensis Ga9.2]|uniref:CBS and Zinc Finger C2H2 domain-containing membrane protein n=1 Tax=Nitrososphaera gargensis (strain Ga9.2) TaxID=1237085 RepID=K0ILW0_NITGG|nr:CBS domain-containing protein [Candidatus Nitrososphaera gargensis]AFU57394.1 CBS and Zinc Finger C2H2 domain-containing membrane protein [Candidatus Nitrososphaera gargensis Ga9.2]
MSYVPDDISSLLSEPIEHYINTNVVILEGDRFTDEALSLMKEKGVRSVLVSHVGEVVGIVSKTDILFKVMSQGRNPGKVRLREIMTSPVLAVNPHNTMQETLSLMDKHVIRQVIVSSHSAVLGMVSRDDIFEKIHMATMSTAHTAIKGTPVCIINPKAIVYMKDITTAKLVCPYCESPFDTKEGLSSHIDRLHSGSGVLEGDVRRMFE